MNNYKFQMTDLVKIIVSGEKGVVIGRAEFSSAEPTYLVRYERADGVATEAWWTETSLATVTA